MTVCSGAAAEFKERLVARVGGDDARVVSANGADVLVLSELTTTLIESRDPGDGPVTDSLTIRTTLAGGISPLHPELESALWALGQTGGLNRWTYRDDGGLLSLESTLLVCDPEDENLLRLGEFLLRSQVSEARAKLFSGLHDTLGGRPALLCKPDGELLWESDDFTIPSFIENDVRPWRERTDL